MPFLSGWGKRKAIEYGTVFPDSTLTDFPLLVVIAADTDIAAELTGGGGITVTAADGDTEIPFGLYPSSDPTSGDIILRFLTDVSTGASTGDVIAYLYYDAGQSTTEDKAGVVANDYAVFMPLEEDPSGSAPQMFDWVSETNKGTSGGSMTSGDLVTAIVANGLDFDGTNDRVDVAVAPVQGAFTWELWTNPSSSGGGFALSALDGGNNGQRIFGLSSGTMVPFAQLIDDGGNATSLTGSSGLTMGVWSHLAWTATPGGSGTAVLYRDGASQDSDSVASTLNTQADTEHTIGDRSDAGSGPYPGGIDEVRISSVARSAAWIEYAFNNDFTPEDTTALGDEEVPSSGAEFHAVGACAVDFTARVRVQGVFGSSGVGALTGAARVRVSSVFTSAGASTALWEALTGAGTFTSAGTGALSGMGVMRVRAAFSASGIGACTGVGRMRVESAFSASGTSTGSFEQLLPTSSEFHANGVSVVTAVARVRVEATFSSAGSAGGSFRGRDGNATGFGGSKLLLGVGR